ncbi:MAG: 3-oxoacyl-ACP reductase [Phycisphaerae bacterium]|nr:3-oxoacyl-ACP reductase [Phycisphaerae bacterium]
MSSLFDLSGRTALVTGSTRGLGRAMAFSLAQCGARVVLNYANDRARGLACHDSFKEAGHEAMLVGASVIDQDDVDRLVAEVESEFGGIDILVVNATPQQPQNPIESYDWEFHQQMIDYFLKSPYLLARRVLPHMKQQRWGRIINIGSEVLARGIGNFSPYVAAKGAQNGWTRSMATELAPHGVTVNMISPGWIPVERHAGASQSKIDSYQSRVPAGRMGVPEDLAGSVAFLASESSGFVTGQNIHVNGGLTTF